MNAVTSDQIMRQQRGELASQAAGIEQSRAIAEVQAAVTVAQRCPRNEASALEKAKESCRTWEVAEGAFYKFSRGGQSVSDASIHLAVELARCWGNISYGIMELNRDDVARVSEMLAFAWDLETNTQSRMTFLVPHVRDTRSGPKALVEMRDIYENNANNGARRLRECIFRVLPPFLKETAKQTCRETLEQGRGQKPLQVRIAEGIAAFEDIGISRDRLEAKIGPSTKWSAIDVANLQVSYRSINRQEISADEEFPRLGVDDTVATARAIADQAKVAKGESSSVEGPHDSQMGEAHSEAQGDPELRRFAIDIITRAAAVKVRGDFDDLEAEAATRLSELPPALIDDVNAALDEAQARITRTEKKGD